MRYLSALLFGAVLGAAVYFIPVFVLKTLFVLTVIAVLTRMMFGRRHYYGRHFAFADKIRSMSEEDYAKMKEQWKSRSHHCGHYERNNNNKEQTQENKNV